MRDGEVTFDAAAQVTLPTRGDVGKHRFAGHARGDSKLHDVQAMVERAGEHAHARARVFVERPEAGVIADEILAQRRDAVVEQRAGGGVASGEPEIPYAPKRPDES